MGNLSIQSRLSQPRMSVSFNAAPDKMNTPPDLDSKSEPKSSEISKKKWTTRDTIDALTTVLYAGIVGFAIYANRGKRPIDRKLAKRVETEKADNIVKKAIADEAKVIRGDYDQGSRTYKVFNYFSRAKDNSAEFTNNIVYGFGTLVVMPLVILFSPIGKKDASKEDRLFTVLRQPISFATVFAMQLTFDKFFKGLMDKLNLHKLLDGAKNKEGKEIFFNTDRFKEVIGGKINKNNTTNFMFNKTTTDKFKTSLNDLKKIDPFKRSEGENALIKFYETTMNILDEHTKGKTETITTKIGEKIKINIKGKGNSYTKNEFIAQLKILAEQFGANKPGKSELEILKEMVGQYAKEMPELPELLENAAKAGYRTKVLKQYSAIIANSIASQALGIMMLNFLYGKMMKARKHFKEEKTSKALNAESNTKAEGGQK